MTRRRPGLGMTAVLAGTVLLAAVLAAQQNPAPQKTPPASAATSPDALLGQALHEEEVEGRLQNAIETYQKVLKAPGVTRAQAGRAQFRIGACYERLGLAEARRAYEAVVANYADQVDLTAQAKARLAALTQPARRGGNGLAVRKLYDGGASGSLSSDGSYLTLVTDSMELAVRELATGRVRQLTKSDKPMEHFAYLSAISPDNRKVAYNWYDETGVFSLWLVNLDGSGNRPLVRGDKEWNVEPSGWFPDGAHILAVRSRSLYFPPAACQIVSVAVSDGSVKILKELGTQTPVKASLSPDGRFIVYDYPPDDSTSRDIYLTAADGGGSTRLIGSPANDYVLGWSPSGTHLLFASDRSGNWGAWLVAVGSGKALGAPTEVKPDVGRINAVGFARDGAFYFGLGGWSFDIYAQDIDLGQGRVLDEPALAVQQFVGSNLSLSWSPDGQYLSYISRRSPGAALAASDALRIRTVKSGAERELVPELGSFYTPRWSPDSRQVMLQGFDRGNRLGDFVLDVSTGTMRPVLQTGRDKYQEAITAEWSSDGRSVFYVRRNSTEPTSEIMTRHLATAQDTPVAASPRQGWFFSNVAASPDGTRIAARMRDETRKTMSLTVLPSRGGEVRTLLELEGNGVGSFAWTPDSRQLLFVKKLPQDRSELWLLSADTGTPRKVADLPARADRLALHPDGRKVAYTVGVFKDEVWVLENFLPPVKPRR